MVRFTRWKRWRTSSNCTGYSFFALTRTSSRTPTLPKSCSSEAYLISRNCVRVNCVVRITAGIAAIDRLGERHRQVRHPERMPRGGRVARFDRHHRRLDEALEQLLDGLVEPRILERHRRLAGHREHHLFLRQRKRDYLLVDASGARSGARCRSSFALISCSTPTTSPFAFFIGTARIDCVIYPESSSKLRLTA